MTSQKFKKIAKEMLKRHRSPAAALRLKAVEHLGAKCRNCSVVDPRVLQIDHVEGGGVKCRRNGITAISEYRRILNEPEGWNDEFQVLCANCNWIKRYELAEYHKGKKIDDPDIERKWKAGPPCDWDEDEDEEDEEGNATQ